MQKSPCSPRSRGSLIISGLTCRLKMTMAGGGIAVCSGLQVSASYLLSEIPLMTLL